MAVANYRLFILVPLALTVLRGCGFADQSAPPSITAATAVRAAQTTSGPAAPAIAANGIVASKDEMRLSFKVGGVIRNITVQEGMVVKAGQKLAEIELAEVNAQVEQARQLALKAQRDLTRGENLYADQVISLEQLQNLRTQTALARAQLQSAEFNRGYAQITAPTDGVVLRRLAEERELVPPGQPVLVVGNTDRGYVVQSALADREIVQLKLGDRATIRLDAFPGIAYAATVSEIASAADPATRLFDIELRLDAAPARLVGGLVAKIQLSPSAGAASELTYIPIAALVEGNRDRASVFVLEDGTARKREVVVAFIAADSVALASGLAPGVTVITDGSLYLEDGERIRVLAAGEPGEA